MRRIIGIVLITLALLQLGFRGAQRVRNDVPMWDFASVYAAAKTWIHGGDPYDVSAVIQTWHESEFFAHRDVSYFATVYPPSSLVMLTPFALLSARAAVAAWFALTIALLIVQFAALIDMAGLRKDDPKVLILVGATLASGGMQFGILSGQLSIPAISLCIIACWCVSREKKFAAGALLGLAFAIKPQVAGPFIAYYFVLRQIRTTAVAGLVAAAIWIVALIAMGASHVHWISGWTQSMASTTQPGAVNDYGWGNRFRDEIIDLKMIAVGFFHSARMLRLAVGLTVAVMFAWYVGRFPRGDRRQGRNELLALAGLSALSLLPIYHRVYDVALLTTALAWALAELDGRFRQSAVAILAAMTVFLVPFDSVKSVGSRLHHLGSLSGKWWWQTLVVPHYAWALLATTVVILVTLGRLTPPKQQNQ